MPSLPTRRLAVPRITLLISLLTLTVILVASLAYEAHDAARSHRVTAERALRDYASVAAWEYVASVQERLNVAASEVLSPVTSVRASSPYELLAPPDLLTTPPRDILACPAASGDSARVDFRVDLRHLLRGLRANGYTVHEAGSGSEALDHLAQRPATW